MHRKYSQKYEQKMHRPVHKKPIQCCKFMLIFSFGFGSHRTLFHDLLLDLFSGITHEVQRIIWGAKNQTWLGLMQS